MRKAILISSIIFFTIFFLCLLIWNLSISENRRRNDSVIAFLDQVALNDVSGNDFESDVFSKFHFNGRDYIGVISVVGHNVVLPIEDVCYNSFIRKQSVCRYPNESFVLFGTSFKDSFINYESYDIGDKVLIKNGLGERFLFEVSSVKREGKFSEIFYNKGDMILVIKDYFSLEYIVFAGVLIG